MIYYLKTSDEQTLWDKLEQAGLVEETELVENGVVSLIKSVKHGVSLDIIGAIQRKTSEVREEQEGMMVPVFETIDGFHANLMVRIEIDEEAEQVLSSIAIEAPATPHRTWFL